MEKPTNCVICNSPLSPTNENQNGDDTDTRALISTLKKILLQQNEADVKPEKQNSEGARLFCLACIEILNEWYQIQGRMSKLLARSKEIKYRLTVNILESDVSLPGQLPDSAALQELLEDFERVKRAVISEYQPSIRLERLAEVPLESLKNCVESNPQNDTPVEDILESSTSFNDEDYHDDWEASTLDATEIIFSDSDDESDELQRKSSSVSGHSMEMRKRKRSATKQYGGSISKTPIKEHIQKTDNTSRRSRPKTSGVNVLRKTLNPHTYKAGQKRPIVTLDNGDIIFDGKHTIKSYGKQFLCPFCGVLRARKDIITDHIRDDHIQDGSKEPEFIGVGANSFLYLNKYGFTFSDNQYNCTTCGIALAKWQNLIDHIQVSHVNGAESLALETSAIETNQPKDTQLLQSGEPDDTPETFYNVDEPCERRRRVVDLDNGDFVYDGKYTVKLCGKKYVCPMCGAQKPSRNGMTEHIRMDHILAKGPNPPEITAVGENSFLYLNKYGFSCSNDQYKCTTCGTTVAQWPSLFEHIQVCHIVGAEKGKGQEKEPSSSLDEENANESESVKNTEKDPEQHKTQSTDREGKSEQDFDDEDEPQGGVNPPSGPRKKYNCIPIGENVFMYAGKYRIVLSRGLYKCPKCSCVSRTKPGMTTHIRQKHLKCVVPLKVQPSNRVVTINENEFMYGDKYRITKINDRYFCVECSNSRPSMHSLTDHIRIKHIRKKGAPEATPESEGQSSKARLASHKLKLTNVGPNEYLYGGQIRISVNDGVYTCGSCGVQMETLKSMRYHVTHRHIQFNNDEFFKSVETLEDGSFKCGKCDFIGTNWHNMYFHNRRHKDSLKKTGSAELRKCIYSVEVSPNHFDHGGWPYKFVPETGLFNCGSCNATFPTQPKITRHIGVVHRNPVEKAICEECGKVLRSKTLLRSHQIRNHPKAKTVPCPECGKLFVGQDDVTRHMKIHLGEAAKKHVCEFCGRRFLKLNYLEKHRATHTGKAPYSCDACDMGYWTQRDLKNHQTTQHPQETVSNNVPAVDTNNTAVAIEIDNKVVTNISSM